MSDFTMADARGPLGPPQASPQGSYVSKYSVPLYEQPANPPLDPNHPLAGKSLRHTAARAPEPNRVGNGFISNDEAIAAAQIREHRK
ncbi:hypothetical protein HYALB_00008499 [Hymenoscyphus albidus]|uniref:Uncharacterized protein n=1 Tax=Hymenoscyphus albidus TaxID=595503 RepID=A0A9N9LPA6_9HELO|nr:hypothetical protein HYALB_00008499 [Hymenoscyphus albidus]